MKILPIFLFTIFAGITATAQQVVASSGNSATAGGYTVAWTLGEPVIETLSGSNNILTQGMHQTNLVVTCKIIKN
jgi:membrane-bound inhibitor of C-type lysozyme